MKNTNQLEQRLFLWRKFVLEEISRPRVISSALVPTKMLAPVSQVTMK